MQATIDLPNELLHRLDALQPFTLTPRELVIQELLLQYVKVNEARRRFANGTESEEDVINSLRGAALEALRSTEW